MMESLQHIVRLLARPIQFASRRAGARLSAVKNLGPFVTRQVVQALAQDVFAPPVETDLLALRQLFSDYHNGLPLDERKRRLAEARAILARLSAGSTPQHSASSAGGTGSPPQPWREGALRTQHVESPRTPRLTPRAQSLWEVPIRFARGVGPKRALLLERQGVRTVEEALWYLPWRYEDRSVVTPIARLRAGVPATICGTVLEAKVRRTARRRLTLVEVTVGDDSGQLSCTYFNQPYLETILRPGSRLMMNGTVSPGRRGWADLRMDAPHYEILGDDAEIPLHVGRIVPIYHETKGLTSRQIRTVTRGLLDDYVEALDEVVPRDILVRLGLPTLKTAMADVHFPTSDPAIDSLAHGTTKAHQRLVFEEFFLLEVALALRRQAVMREIKGVQFDTNTPLRGRLQNLLPFRLTPAQERVLLEIVQDMGATHPMNRLIQGDVGCGKTIVALQAMALACGSGYQAALMVPTETLAEQHFLNVRDLLTSLGLKAVLLKSGGSRKARAATVQAIETGEADVVIGTHALIQKDVRFSRLGLAVIDEQHKFGVLQRKLLVEKGYRPDVLVLTATPIPRTLAMTVYGDLDVSVIDALPPGRKPIRTLLFSESQRRRAYQRVRDELLAGRQAYIVYPLVQESEKSDLRAALQGAQRLRDGEFHRFQVGLLHGRMKAGEKERTMAGYKAGEIHLLVATTVVEVGIDVPNATVMVVEHADRFGLAQLHQLRGRVGRGARQSYCLLVATGGVGRPDPGFALSSATQRLETLVRSSDGFVIAEEDLRMRGPGELLGVRQWGLPEFRAANLVRDGLLLAQARHEAFALLAADPGLTDPAHRTLRTAMLRRWQAQLDLGSIS